MTIPDMVARVVELEREITRLETLEAPVPVAGGGDVTFIETQTVAVATHPITFSSIPGIYRHLLFVCSLRSAVAGEDDLVLYHVNNIGLNNAAFYSYFTRWAGSPKTIGNTPLANQLLAGYCNGASSPANTFAPITLWLMHYNLTDRNRQFRGQWAFGKDDSAPDIESTEGAVSSVWRNTADAVNRIDFETWAGASNFVAGSKISMFGVG